tara:strand:+ start:2368 stop:2991 length:624 start_codon:yes stop_codon:yes gene_type:complete
MKKIINISIILIAFISCKAQTTIIPLFSGGEYGRTEGAYYKDVDNFLNNFEGIWLWAEGNSSLTLELKKITQHQSTMPLTNVNYYEDFLIGEYKYVENGSQIVNTLPQLTFGTQDQERNIFGNFIIHRYIPPQCTVCPLNELRVKLNFWDNERDYLRSSLVLRHGINSSGQEYIIAKLYGDGTYVEPYQNAPTEPRVPYGEYVLLKQ